MRSLIAAAALAMMLTGCYVEPAAGVYGDVTWLGAPPPYAWDAYPRVQYRGGWAYLVNGRWYYNRDGRWGTFRREPQPLYRWRLQSPRGPVYQAPPAYRGPPAYGAPPYRGPYRAPPYRGPSRGPYRAPPYRR